MKRFKKLAIAICFSLIACLVVEAAYLPGFATAAVSRPTLKLNKLSVRVGAKVKIDLNNKNSKATYTYKSSNTKVASVTKAGTVTGVKAGTVTITVTETYNKKKTEIGKATVTVQPKLDYDKMIAGSLVSTGNNYRMKKAIEKAQNGEDVTIAFIGGSITEGALATTVEKSWSYLAYDYFKKTFGKGDGSNVHYVNAGMSGTPSSLGMIRYKRDVVDRSVSAPDVVFVEFAVNDNDDTTKGDAYESLVRNILNAENQPAVVLMFSIFQSGRWNLQDRLQPVGEHYNLPMISIKDAIVPYLNSTALLDSEFWAADGWHPMDYGHKIMGDCVNYYFDALNKETKAEADITFPAEAKIGKSFEGIQMIDSKNIPAGVTVKAGDFSATDFVLGTFKYAPTTKTFPNNWMHAAAAGKSGFKMTLDCKNLVMVYKKGSQATFGAVDVYVDGVKTKTFNGSSGWNNPWTDVVINNEASATHTIEIRMAAGSEAKDFSILAFGYTK
jgi:hypothetical protein